ncbi:MAG TPA: O-antigen ligase family protein, partial [Longimicrobiales bacterium]|nr:O-antigen ligase family protein [Longimicrobiales bacterium]
MNRHAQPARPNGRAVVHAAGGWAGAPYVALAMIAVAAVRLHEFIPGAALLQPALLATFAGGGIVLFRSTARARAATIRHPLAWLVTAYWVVIVLTVPFALWPGLAFGIVRSFLPGVAFVLAMLMCARDHRSALILQSGIVLVVAAYGLYVMTLGRITGAGRLDPGAGMYDSNDMAAMLALTFPLAMGLARTQRGKLRTLMAGAGLLLVAVILASGSRGGLLGLGMGAVVFAMGMKGSTRLAAISGIAVAVAGLWNFSPSFQARVESMTNLEDDYNLTDEVGRKAVWERGRQYIRENPVLGVGAGNFPVAEGEYFRVTYVGLRGGKWSSAHNAYIQAYAELGLIGGTLFVAMLLYGLLRGWRLWRGVRLVNGGLAHRPELLAGLSAFMMSGIFLSHAYFLPLMALLGLIAVVDGAASA